VIDANDHVNNVAYLQWMQDVAILHFRALGGTAMMEGHGASWVARSHRIEYLRPVFRGEELQVKTWIVTMDRVRSLRRYEFAKGEQVVVTGETDWVFVDANTGRPKRIPEEMKDVVREETAGGPRGAG
jgi:acyl-CoA thioester hydrolase